MSHGPRSGERQKPGRKGPGGVIVRSRRSTANHLPSASRTSAAAKPAPSASDPMASTPTNAHANQSLTTRGASSRTRVRRVGAPGGSSSTSSVPAGESSSRARRRSAPGAPPMPMLPSSSSAVSHVPAPGIEPNSEPSTASTPRARAICTATGERSTPSDRPGSAARWRPGPQPRSSTGAVARSRMAASAASAGPSQRPSGSGSSGPPARRMRPPAAGSAPSPCCTAVASRRPYSRSARITRRPPVTAVAVTRPRPRARR